MRRFICLHEDSYVSKKVERVQNWHFNLSHYEVTTLLLPRSKEKLVYLLYNKVTLYLNHSNKFFVRNFTK